MPPSDPIRSVDASSAVPARYLILEEKPNPSTDYFVMGALKARLGHSHVPIERLHWGQKLDSERLRDASVLVVRYVTGDWRAAIERHRQAMAELIYFFDDDIPDTKASRGLPLKYRYKLYRHGARHFDWLIAQNARLWVSTEYLRDKYQRYSPVLIEPQQLPKPSDRIRVFYHATASHAEEIQWLYPVMQAVLEQAPEVDFEIVGDRRTLALYRKLPRTTVVHPMSWQAYQHFVAWPGRHIGLAPFLPGAFNAARSYTKVFDIERAGATGVLADSGPWAKLPLADNHRLVPMDQALWVEAIVRLSQARAQPAGNA